jgi:hypothetical protein
MPYALWTQQLKPSSQGILAKSAEWRKPTWKRLQEADGAMLFRLGETV